MQLSIKAYIINYIYHFFLFNIIEFKNTFALTSILLFTINGAQHFKLFCVNIIASKKKVITYLIVIIIFFITYNYHHC